MNRMRVLFVVFVVLALTISVAVAQPGKTPPGQDEDTEKIAAELAVFGEVPDGTADISSNGWSVLVGTDVQTYSPEPIQLHLSKELVGDILAGSQWGMARVLRKNAREGGRLDFYFNCGTNDLNSCAYRLIVRFGIHDKKTDTVWFDPGSMELYQRPQGSIPGELMKEGKASFSVTFQK